MTDTEPLRALLDAATPGPWRQAAIGPWDVYPDVHTTVPAVCRGGTVQNAALIVTAVNALPALLTELDALRAENERLRDAARYVVQLGNQPGMDDDEWEAAMTALGDALAGEPRV